MKINIYYGGRGLIGDPTRYVISRMQTVLEELNATVNRYDLYEMKNSITTLPQTLKDADGIILATTVEWYGIGGYMQQFLDACWLYGDKERIAKIYMCPVVMSTTYGEREGKLNLQTAWEILGGLPASGICGYISELSSLECNDDYVRLIEKKTENFYRTINQKFAAFPASNQAVKQKITKTQNVDLTPQETEQLSIYASDESYVKQQKQDIKELANIFSNRLEHSPSEEKPAFIDDFKRVFEPQVGLQGIYRFVIKGYAKNLIVRIQNNKLEVFYGSSEFADVEIQVEENVLKSIISGSEQFQKCFLSGNMKMKGDFAAVRNLDAFFPFASKK